jgi:ParB family chromosome partitioning protein
MSKNKFGLGRGLGALLPTGDASKDAPVSVVPTADTRDDGASTGILAHIEISRIQPNPYQPRTDFDPLALSELAQSIQENGLVQPITVRRFDGGYQLISGERRVRACQEAGVTHVPAYIRAVDSVEEMIELALIENIQRETLNPIEIANSYRRLIDEYRHTQDDIARKVGKNRATVANFVRLLRLPDQIQASIQKGEFSFGHARALLGLPDSRTQIRVWKRALREGLSVRRVEELVRETLEPRPRKEPARRKPRATAHGMDEIESRLRSQYATKVSVTPGKDGGGVVTLEFYSADDLERIIEILLR